jgi:hypothetical protein
MPNDEGFKTQALKLIDGLAARRQLIADRRKQLRAEHDAAHEERLEDLKAKRVAREAASDE